MSDGYFSMLNMPDAKERRRYALLQAAATIQAGEHFQTLVMALNDAETLLAEIEKREEAK